MIKVESVLILVGFTIIFPSIGIALGLDDFIIALITVLMLPLDLLVSSIALIQRLTQKEDKS